MTQSTRQRAPPCTGRSPFPRPCGRRGSPRAEIEALEAAGVIASVAWENKRVYGEADCRIMKLARRRAEAGLPFAQSLKSFAVYMRSLQSAVEADIEAIISGAILPESPAAGEIVHMIRVSDETLDEFVSLKRYELNRAVGSRRIEDIGRFSAALRAYLTAVQAALTRMGGSEQAELSGRALQSGKIPGNGNAAEALRQYAAVIHLSGEGLAESIAACSKANHFFGVLEIGAAATPENLLLHALLIGWLRLAPGVLLCGRSAEAADAGFAQAAAAYGAAGGRF